MKEGDSEASKGEINISSRVQRSSGLATGCLHQKIQTPTTLAWEMASCLWVDTSLVKIKSCVNADEKSDHLGNSCLVTEEQNIS